VIVLVQPELLTNAITIRLTRSSGEYCVLLSLCPESEKPSARPDKLSSSTLVKICLLMPALAANDFEFLAIVNRDVVAKKFQKRYMVSAIQFKFFACKGPLKDIPQQFSFFVFFFFFICHSCLLKNKSPVTF
jgi:hypothetical protein